MFLDRDGTLVRDHGYVHRLEDYALLPGVPEALGRLRDAGLRLAIVTNQSGIGRGYYDQAAFEAFQARLVSDLRRARVEIERTYWCPHRPDAACACRKPEPGLLLRARDELGADLSSSWVVGDREIDVELARRAGCRGAVWLSPPAGATPGPGVLVASDLREAAEQLVAACDPARRAANDTR